MAQWYHFYHTEDDAEILVGLYDRWLSHVMFGPTQAERCLLHTEMMETAHERRFLVAQTSADMSEFEIDHSRRITDAIGHLERNFISRPYDDSDTESEVNFFMDRSSPSGATDEVNRNQEQDVAGMIVWTGHKGSHDYFDDLAVDLSPPPQWLQLKARIPTPLPPSPGRAKNIETEIDVDDAESDGYLEEQYRAALTNLTSTSSPNKRGWDTSNSAKMVKEIRMRKRVKAQHEDDTKPTDTPAVRSHVTRMSLDSILN